MREHVSHWVHISACCDIIKLKPIMDRVFKERLRSGELLIGALVTLANSEVGEIFAEVGFQWLWLDMEHAPLDVAAAQHIVQTVAGVCPVIIRVPVNDTTWIKRVLDTGCDGVIVPQVQSALDARQAVASCKYPPAGVRSVGISRAQKYGLGFQRYIDTANDDITVILQVEHVEGVNQIDAITAVPGVDAVVVGPYDLSASMGLIGQVGHDAVQQAVRKVIAACREKGLPVGAFAGDSQTARDYISGGCSLVALGIDTLYLSKAAKQALAELTGQ
jgi:2-keto-3-deoxy-L-rhamnonate aldolase RhmA